MKSMLNCDKKRANIYRRIQQNGYRDKLVNITIESVSFFIAVFILFTYSDTAKEKPPKSIGGNRNFCYTSFKNGASAS